VPFLLRSIRRGRWHEIIGTSPTEEEIRKGPLLDLVSENSTLSVWYIESDKSNLERITIALASRRDSFSNFDYALINEQLLVVLDIKVVQTNGETPDQEANTRWHRDLVELSDSKLIALARTIAEKGETARILEKKMAFLIREAVNAGRLDRTKLSKNIASKLKA
jgi:hypothetical protein